MEEVCVCVCAGGSVGRQIWMHVLQIRHFIGQKRKETRAQAFSAAPWEFACLGARGEEERRR